MTDRVRLLIVSAAAVALIAFQAFAKPRPDPHEINATAQMFAQPEQWHGRLAPDFELPLLDGGTFKLSDRIGRHAIVLNFFATWCGPCRAEMPELQRYQAAHAGDGMLLVGIDAEEKHTVVERFAQELGLTFPIGIDGSGELLRLYGVTAFPSTVVIGADGRVKLYETGAIHNADVAFSGVLEPEWKAIREKRGITADAYRAALAREPDRQDDTGIARPLEGRALRIAQAMPCPCGCEDTIHTCGCQTSKRVKARLAEGAFGEQTDTEIMQALNREFCMKGTQ